MTFASLRIQLPGHAAYGALCLIVASFWLAASIRGSLGGRPMIIPGLGSSGAFLAAAVGVALALLAAHWILRRRTVDLTRGTIVVAERSLLRRSTWGDPLSSYRQILVQVEQQRHRYGLCNWYVVRLWHPEPGKRIDLARARDAAAIEERARDCASRLGLPLVWEPRPVTPAAACLPKLRRIQGLGRTHVMAGLLFVFAVACAPAATVRGSPVAETDPATLAEYQRCDESQAGRPVDLSRAVLTFADEFDRPSITAPEGEGPWFAPIHGGFGQAEFLPPHPSEGPFFFDGGVLTVRLAKLDGRWTSGIVQSVNAKGEGFTQRYGYFEMRAKFPKGNGTWPAFWLKTVNQFTDQSQTRAEIDIIEAYGGNDWSGYHATVHLWPARHPGPGQLRKHWHRGCYERVEGDMFDGDWHLYGAEVGPEWVTIYYERREVGRFPTLVEFNRPLFILADLALHGEDPRATDEPADMQIDYIRVWQRQEWLRMSE